MSTATAQALTWSSGETIFPSHTEEWAPANLIGRFRDVTHCNHCGREFQPADDGYLAYWVVSQEEFRLWEEVQREQPPEDRTSPPADT